MTSPIFTFGFSFGTGSTFQTRVILRSGTIPRKQFLAAFYDLDLGAARDKFLSSNHMRLVAIIGRLFRPADARAFRSRHREGSRLQSCPDKHPPRLCKWPVPNRIR